VNTRIVSTGIICAFLSVTLIASAQAQSKAPPSAVSPSSPAVLTGTAFRYQGQLKNGSTPVNSTCDFSFSLYNAVSSGSQVGGIQDQTIIVTNGLFTTELDFGTLFRGDARWLSILVRCPAGSGLFSLLAPRQPIKPVPYALFSTAPWVTNGTDIHYSAGRVGIGTTTPAHHLSIAGGPSWTSNGWAGAVELTDAAAIGWQKNTNGQGFGIGQTSGGLYFFHTTSNPGTMTSSSNYDMLINNAGNVGVGTTNAGARLTVRGPDTNIETIAFQVENSAGLVGLKVWDDRTVGIGALYGSSTTHACYVGSFYSFAACSSAAEYVPTIDAGAGFPVTADLVSIAPAVGNPYTDEHAPFVVTKSAIPCDANLLGFIVNPASGADGKQINEHYLPLAIYGYFPAKVALENGAIRRGDPLTSSSKAGYAMKATQACKIIGYALEDANKEGTIQVFANHGESAASEVAALRMQVQELKDQNAALDARLTTLEKKMSGATK
jgi:hypothetical protein